MYRSYPLTTGTVHHVMNKSIAGYQIFNHDSDYIRMIQLIRFFQYSDQPNKFSLFLERDPGVKLYGFEKALQDTNEGIEYQVQIIAYCLMPTHFHLLLKQTADNGISEFLRKILNGYARYYNTKYSRQGTLWMSRFKNVPVFHDEHLLHVSRYININATTAGLVKNPEDWLYSSYDEYVSPEEVEHPLTQHTDLFDITPVQYREFCRDHQDFQKSLAAIKHEILE